MSDLQESLDSKDSSNNATKEETKELIDNTGSNKSGLFLEFYQYETGPEGTTLNTPKALFIQKMDITTDPKTITLREIRAMMKDQKTMKSMQSSPFCTNSGSEISDEVYLEDYFTIGNTTQTKDNQIYPIYLKTMKLTGAADDNFRDSMKNNFNKELNLDTTQKDLPLTTTQAPTIQSSLDMNNYTVQSGSVDAIHPADMTELQWSIVIRDNGLLCGHSIATSEVNESDTTSTVAKTIERVEYPAFILKPREFEPYDLATAATANTAQYYRIPRFQVDDDAYVREINTKSSLQSSLAESSFSATDVEAAVGGGAFGVTIAAKAGVKISNSQGEATAVTNDEEKLMMTYNFPRVRVTFDNESLDLSRECKTDLEKISDLNSIDWFVKKYGTFYARRVQLGGRLYCSTSKEASGQSSVTERTHAFKAAASASFSCAFASGSASASHEQGGASKALENAANLNVSVAWEGQGGDTLLSNNPGLWCPTVGSFYNWRVVKQDEVQPLIDIIGQIPGYENIPEKFKKILEAEQRPQPPLKTDFTGPGTYSLIDRNSGKAVDLNGGNREDGTKIQIFDWQSGNHNQYWYISDAGNDQYHILSGQTGAYLTYKHDNQPVTANMICATDSRVKWKLVAINDGEGAYLINSVSSPSQVLDVAGLGQGNLTTIQTWTVTKAKNQQFFIRLCK